MRIQVLSDLHADAARIVPPRLASDVDCVIVAGDTCEGIVEGFAYLRQHLPLVPIITVAGNHEHYCRVMSEGIASARKAAPNFGITFLENDSVTLGGVRFVGCTLWTDYALSGLWRRESAMRGAGMWMSDHQMIAERRQPPTLFCPAHALAIHKKSRVYLAKVLAEPHDGPTVVITHHVPHPGSIAPRYRDDDLNPAFASDLGDLILATQPDLWVHGHTHASFDYRVGRTRILCNPHGYGNENPSFDPALVVEIGRPTTEPREIAGVDGEP